MGAALKFSSPFRSSEMEEELVRPVPRQPKRHRPPRVLRLTLGGRGRGRRRLGKRVQRENQEARQEDHPLVRVHLHPAGADGELSQRQHGGILCGDQRQDARVRCREDRHQGLDGYHVWYRISGIFFCTFTVSNWKWCLQWVTKTWVDVLVINVRASFSVCFWMRLSFVLST